MARRKKTKVRRIYVKAKKRRSKSKGGVMNTVIGAMLYGAVRERASNMLSPVTANIPAGEIADEVVMLGVSWALAKGKVPFVNKIDISKKIGKAGVVIESARIGEFIAGKGLGGMTTTGITSSVGNPTVF